MQNVKRLTLTQIAFVVLILLGIFFVTRAIFSSVVISTPIVFTINEGESLKSLSVRLEGEGLIRSSALLRLYLSFNNKDRKVQLGEYEFSGNISLFSLAREITEKGPKNPLLVATIPEGSTSLEVYQIFAKALPSIDKNIFFNLIAANNLEGKLFPSTYHLLPSYKETTIIDLMAAIYLKKVIPIIEGSVAPQPLSGEKDILILASILEGEANTEKDMKIVAGILLERIRIGMPLQVDVAPETYKRRGLPKEPINNPGVVAITSVLHPISTEYLYYITGKDGNMYYAETFNGHKKNIQKYLK